MTSITWKIKVSKVLLSIPLSRPTSFLFLTLLIIVTIILPKFCSAEEINCEETESSGSTYKDCKPLSLVGGRCDNVTSKCIPNAICTSNGVCTCQSDYKEDKVSRECIRPQGTYGSSCNNETQLCNSDKFLSCSPNQICQCHHSKDQNYDTIKGTCVGKIGHLCERHKWADMQLGCSENAYCFKKDDYFGVCKCNVGYTILEADSHICEPIRGKHCNSISDCKDEFNFDCIDNTCQCKEDSVIDTCQCPPGFMETSRGQCQLGPEARNCSEEIPSRRCHQESKLHCIDDVCQCQEGFVFDPSLTMCIGIDGSPCDLFNINTTPYCVPHAECNKEEGLCRCKDTFVVDENGHCQGHYGTLCSLDPSHEVDPAGVKSSVCPSKLGLKCQGPGVNGFGTCSCLEGSGTTFDDQFGRCLLRIGEKCKSHMRCISNSFCGTGNKCQCYSGYSQTPYGECMLDYGRKCGDGQFNEKTCNFYRGLECINGSCACSSDQIYNDSIMECLTMVTDTTTEMMTTTEAIVQLNSSLGDPRASTGSTTETPSRKNAANVFSIAVLIIIVLIVIFTVHKYLFAKRLGGQWKSLLRK